MIDTDRIRQELKQLQQELHSNASQDNCSGVALYRIVPTQSGPQLEELVEELCLDSWLTVPLKGDPFPALEALFKRLDELCDESGKDRLTALFNAEGFMKLLELETERARQTKTSLSVAKISVSTNDCADATQGKICKEQMLSVSAALAAVKRGYDLAARLDDTTFAVAFSGIGQVKCQKQIKAMIDNLNSELQEKNIPAVTLRVGISTYRGTVKLTGSELFDLAAGVVPEEGIALAKLPDIADVPKETLVCANEKKFLFGKF
ncbi:MAG: GGDEF domain-containing protein [Desulfovibrio sp.]